LRTTVRAMRDSLREAHAGHREKVPEQFIRPLNQVHIHAAPISSLLAMLKDG
jgi:hypothetical protein